MEQEDTPELSFNEAFDAIGNRLAGLTASVDGFAARQQELLARDYAEEFAGLEKRWQSVEKVFSTLKERPGVKLTPELVAVELERGAKLVRKADHEAMAKAEDRMMHAVKAIDDALLSARTAMDQKRALQIVAGVAAMLAFVAGCTVPAGISRMAPERWLWPEKRAAAILEKNTWDAGMRLMQVAQPEQWDNIVEAMRIYEANGAALEQCAKDAQRRKESVTCRVRIAPQ